MIKLISAQEKDLDRFQNCPKQLFDNIMIYVYVVYYICTMLLNYIIILSYSVMPMPDSFIFKVYWMFRKMRFTPFHERRLRM